MQPHVRCLIVAILILAGPEPSRAEEAPRELATIVEEAHAAAGAVTHGTLSGAFQREHENADGTWQIVDEATLSGSFKDGRYRLRLDYTRQRLDEERRTIVYDGETLATGVWCQRIKPARAEW